MTENDTLTQAWSKITGQPEAIQPVGRAGYIPVFDSTYNSWRVFRNTYVIYEPAENCADPVKVEHLRRNASNVVAHYPETIPSLEKLGVRVKQLLNRPIKTPEDVTAWATSVFNVGPVNPTLPAHVADTLAIVYDDFSVQVGIDYVVPEAPRGSGNAAVVIFDTPYGKRRRLGPRSELAKEAFKAQNQQPIKGPQKAVEPPEAPAAPVTPKGVQGAPTEGRRRRGRPRSDGLVSGSPEAKLADVEKRRTRRWNRRAAARQARTQMGATITHLQPTAEEEEAEPERHRLRRRTTYT